MQVRARHRDGRRDDEGEVLLQTVRQHRRAGLDLEHLQPGASPRLAHRQVDRLRHAGVRLFEQRPQVVGEVRQLRADRLVDLPVDARDPVRHREPGVRGRHVHVDRLQPDRVLGAHDGLRLDAELERDLELLERQGHARLDLGRQHDAPLREAHDERPALPGVAARRAEERERPLPGLRHRVLERRAHRGGRDGEVNDEAGRLRVGERRALGGGRPRWIHGAEARAAGESEHRERGRERRGQAHEAVRAT